jgi:phosphoenolpyruvate-protein phosphotransferase (PTS system enzyme I)
MELLKGVPAAPGVAIATAVVLDAEDIAVPRRPIVQQQVDAEKQRLHGALDAARAEVDELRRAVTANHGQEIGGVFDFHLSMLRDKSMIAQIEKIIATELVTTEHAVSLVLRKNAATFAKMADRYFSERVKDIFDIEKRILRRLFGQQQEQLAHLDREVIVIAHDLWPSQTAQLDRKWVRGFACEVGGRTSHTAIVARAMSIPAVVGLGNVASVVNPGDTIIVDGTHGVVIVNPTQSQLQDYANRVEVQKRFEIELASLRDLPAVTTDGHAITLQANIEFPHEVEEALARGATGVGLYRTEFLYLGRQTEPTEEDHYIAYKEVVEKMKGHPVVLRTLDLGADKYDPRHVFQEANPFLGNRSIRLCLKSVPMFTDQLRAILRVALLGDVKLMFPMITTMPELRQASMILKDAMDELDERDVPYKRDIPVGIMIEVPSAALMAPTLAKEAKFFSIGTNDLVQYTLAVDRTNERVAGLYIPGHPSVLSLIKDTIRAGARAEIPVSVCGEMAGDPLYTLLLMGLGLTTFSMNAPDIPEVKRIIRSTTYQHAKEVARKVMSFDSERQINNFLRDETRKILPEVL